MIKNKFKKTELGLIPNDWEVKPLGEIADYIAEKIDINNLDNNYYISTENMLPNKNGVTQAKNIPKSGKINRFNINDILFSNIRTYFKKLWLAKFQGGASNDVLIIRGKNIDVLNQEYLYYFLSQNLFFNYTVRNSKGTKMPRGDKRAIMNFFICYPSRIPEQRAIAKILFDLDSKIELLQKQNETLEKIGQTIFKHWFVDFEFPNEKGKPYKSSGDKMIDSELGQIPEEWGIGILGDHIQPIKGKNITRTQAKGGQFPVIAGGLTPSCYHNKANTCAPVITISASGANAGFVCLHHRPVWSSDSSYIDYSITPYVYFYYSFLKYNQVIITDKQEGSAQPHIYPSHLMELKIHKCSKKLIQMFENFCDSVFNIVKNNNEQIQTLQRTRDLLLPQLMTGKIRVPLKK